MFYVIERETGEIVIGENLPMISEGVSIGSHATRNGAAKIRAEIIAKRRRERKIYIGIGVLIVIGIFVRWMRWA